MWHPHLIFFPWSFLVPCLTFLTLPSLLVGRPRGWGEKGEHWIPHSPQLLPACLSSGRLTQLALPGDGGSNLAASRAVLTCRARWPPTPAPTREADGQKLMNQPVYLQPAPAAEQASSTASTINKSQAIANIALSPVSLLPSRAAPPRSRDSINRLGAHCRTVSAEPTVLSKHTPGRLSFPFHSSPGKILRREPGIRSGVYPPPPLPPSGQCCCI